MALLAMCIAMFIVLAAWPPPSGIESPQAAEQAQKEKPHNNPLIAFWRWTTHDAVAFYTAALFLVTGVLSAVAIAQIDFLASADETARITAKAAGKAADVAKDTLVASHRAWLRPDVAVGQLSFNQLGAHTDVLFEMKNIGNAPALHVACYAWLVPMIGGAVPNGELKPRCDEIRRKPIGWGFSLFPGQKFPNDLGLAGYSVTASLGKDDVERATIVRDGIEQIEFFVMGCVDYTFPADSTVHHQTQFMFQIMRRDNYPISPAVGTIPGADLHLLSNTAGGAGRDAD
jgi:hypothetical protein